MKDLVCEACGYTVTAIKSDDLWHARLYESAMMQMMKDHLEDHLYDDIRAGRVERRKREGDWETVDTDNEDFPFVYRNRDTGETVRELYYYAETGKGEPYDGKPPRGRPRLVGLGVTSHLLTDY